ncbi:MAG: hypothetical protein ABR502_00290 [Chitinophagaceae bacterium]
MSLTSYYIQACTKAWLTCENLLIGLFENETSFSQRTMQVIDECSHICFGTIQALEQQQVNLHQIALLCVGICEECAEVCDRYTNNVFSDCAATCRECSAIVAQLISAPV